MEITDTINHTDRQTEPPFSGGSRDMIFGVLLLGCKFGDDYQCHFVKGSELCNRRKENISESLKRLGVEPERVDQLQVAIDEYDTVPGLIDQFMDMIVKIGPNPFKGY